MTPIQSIVLRNSSNPANLPNPAKQRTAFPPNYVHSLDSTHMMLTANACRKNGECCCVAPVVVAIKGSLGGKLNKH